MSDRLAAILASLQIYMAGSCGSVVTRLLQRIDLVLLLRLNCVPTFVRVSFLRWRVMLLMLPQPAS